MAVQIMQAPGGARSTATAGRAVAVYLWMRFHRMFEMTAAAWLIAAFVDHTFFDGALVSSGSMTIANKIGLGATIEPQRLIPLAAVPLVLLLTPMMAISEIDEHLWTLPARTETLVRWLMLYGSGAVALLWIANAVLIWRPAGLDAPIWWPAAMLAAVQATALAIRCQPYAFGLLHALLYVFFTGLLIVGGVCAAAYGESPGVLEAAYLTTAALAYPLAVAGARRTRRGDRIGELTAADVRETRRPRPPFRSADRAQAWFEWRGSGYYIPAALATLGVLTLPLLAAPLASEVLVITLLTHGTRHLEANMWAQSVPPLLVAALLYFSLVIGGAAPGMRESDKTLSPFLATRPFDCAGLVAAKLRAAALSSAAAWAALVPFFLIWIALPARENGRETHLGAALWSALAPILTTHVAALAGIALLFAIFLSWKLQVETLFLHLTGRPWVAWAYTGLIATPLLIPPFYTHVLTNPVFRPWLPGALIAAVAIKLILGASVVRVLRRRGILSAQTLRSSLLLWTGVALAFTLALCAALAPEHIAGWRLALGMILFMPGVRLGLAPMALAWDRSR